MLIYGTSGHAKVIIDCCKALNIPLTGVFDDGSKVQDPFYDHSVYRDYKENLHRDLLVIGIGNNKTRKEIACKVKPLFTTIIHPTAIVHKDAIIGDGTVIFHGAIIQVDSVIGKHVIINTGASVDHDCQIDDFVHIAPNATLCGGISIGEGTLVGAGSTILPNLNIGKWVKIGAGAVITKDIPDGVTVVGNPGKIIH